ncbi:MAG: J domain-containing protein [Acidithiobacillus caldus]|nr:J domain-containing protein [Acidithiobacillus caldus]
MTTSNIQPYRVLAVPHNATIEEIRISWRRLSRRYHPDHNPGNPQAASRFREVQAAWEILSDPERRAEYDRLAARSLHPNPEAGMRRIVATYLEGFDGDA